MAANSTKGWLAGLVAIRLRRKFTCKGMVRDGTFHYGAKELQGREVGERNHFRERMG